MELVDALIKVGFTRHEAVLYLALCKEGELTGYEAAKYSGIPRSNAYLALAGLVEKGGAFKIESEAARYTAVPIHELAANLRRDQEAILNFLENNIPDQTESTNPYITIIGKKQIVHKMKNIINQAEDRLYLSMAATELLVLNPELVAALGRGLKVVLITDRAIQLEQAIIYNHHKQPGQVRLIADSTQVLTGELSDRPNVTCLYSMNPNLVQLIKDSLTNEIELVRLQQRGNRQKSEV
ncbi:MAG TPA: helix-turn-helix domain-containing protein [Bacillota bacterium]|nr:helix-turn-helix domain-containing protein [Bacillota bacterium]